MATQLETLTTLGLVGAGEAAALTGAASGRASPSALVAVHPSLQAASALVEHVAVEGRRCFVVEDMTDVDAFMPIESVTLPDAPVYLVHGLERGDEMANWNPNEALPAVESAGRTPLTLNEGLSWLLQDPLALERNRCFMTIGSRLRRADGRLDARTPAIWFSNGTGRDGLTRRNAPKVGWCWAGNRHTWLGFASAADRSPLA